DGTLVRDYFYVKDAVEAYLLLAEQLPDQRFVGEAFNFGTETPVSVLALVEQILSLRGTTSLEPVILNESSHEIPRQFLDCSKARRMLDWKPSFDPDDALRETIAWYETWLRRGERS
ncbi:MAG: sugar dehydratase, partial [Planctomycetes bacterium]|nr:sugar dehydratase [Planctomycetota bacterium]